uniref:Putative secreted protein n=1 Tax=Anopheles darlingi TaxID=43151 RepID=A0A2M4DL20_ANODA
MSCICCSCTFPICACASGRSGSALAFIWCCPGTGPPRTYAASMWPTLRAWTAPNRRQRSMSCCSAAPRTPASGASKIRTRRTICGMWPARVASVGTSS